MFGIQFLNYQMLWALSALGIPLIIHLLFKVRRRTVPFSSIEFILASSVKQQNRMRLKELFLLLLRMAAVACLVFAFARPIRALPATGRYSSATTTGIVIDDTCSMRSRLRGKTAFDWAKSKGVEHVSKLPAGSKVAVLRVSRPVIGNELYPTEAAGFLRSLQATFYSAALTPAVEKAAKFISSHSGGNRRLIIISDFQRTAVHGLQEELLKLPDSCDVRIEKVPRIDGHNLAVTGLVMDDYLKGMVHVKLIGSQVRRKTTCDLSVRAVDRKEYSTGKVEFRETGTQVQEFSLGPLRSGTALAASLSGSDALEADNTRFFVAGVFRKLRVLCVEEEPATANAVSPSRFIRAALAPEAAVSGRGYKFEISSIPVDEMRKASLLGRDMVVLSDLSGLTASQVSDLEEAVKSGAGCIVFLGPSSEPEIYNGRGFRKGSGFLPARLVRKQEVSRNADQFWFLTGLKTDHPALAPFALPGITGPSVANFWGRVKVAGVQSTSTVLATFDDGMPAVVTHQFGIGRVILVASTPDREWNDMPLHKFFLPLVHNLTEFAAGRKPHLFPSLKVGQPLSLRLEDAPLENSLYIRRKGHGRRKVLVDGTAVRLEGFDQPGIYYLDGKTMHSGSRKNVRVPIAVNIDDRESILERSPPALFRRDSGKPSTIKFYRNEGEQFRSLCHWFLTAALALLAIELLVANRLHFK